MWAEVSRTAFQFNLPEKVVLLPQFTQATGALRSTRGFRAGAAGTSAAGSAAIVTRFLAGFAGGLDRRGPDFRLVVLTLGLLPVLFVLSVSVATLFSDLVCTGGDSGLAVEGHVGVLVGVRLLATLALGRLRQAKLIRRGMLRADPARVPALPQHLSASLMSTGVYPGETPA